MRVDPVPSPEEVAAIAAALREVKPVQVEALNRSRWRLAGLLGRAVPQTMNLEGSLWSYSSWEEMT